MSPTITTPAMTQAGMLLGTAAYMSPEQARGTAVDKRADVWAFGVVLWEMLTGKRLFEGATVSDTLAAVLKTEPQWNALAPATPTAIRRLLRRCLEKDRKRRLDSAAAARLEIEDALTAPSALEGVASPVTSSALRGRLAGMVAFAVAAVLAAALAMPAVRYLRETPPPEPVVTRLDVVTPPTSDAFSFALSHDGRQLAFVANGEKGSQLWLRPLDQVRALPLAGTEGAAHPFWAPDGRAIGFFADGKLKRIDLAGGSVQVLADAPLGRGGTWSPDDVIVFAPTTIGALLRVAATGGTTAAVTRMAAGQGSHRYPQFLPDSRRFLFLMATGQPETRGLYVGSLDGGEPTRVMAAETAAAYAASGYLLLVSQEVLAAYPFDVTRGTVTGAPIPVAQSVGTDDGSFHSAFSVSAAGVLAHRPGAGSRRQLAWVDRSGKLLGAIGQPDESAPANPELAPDGQRVAVGRTVQGNPDVWLIEAGRGVPSRFTFDSAIDGASALVTGWEPGRLSVHAKRRLRPVREAHKWRRRRATAARDVASEVAAGLVAGWPLPALQHAGPDDRVGPLGVANSGRASLDFLGSS